MGTGFKHAAPRRGPVGGGQILAGDREKLAKMVFCTDNPPDTQEISGSQASVGSVFPGLAQVYYEGACWPFRTDRLVDELALQFVEGSLHLMTLGRDTLGFRCLTTRESTELALRLLRMPENCWHGIVDGDIERFGFGFRQSFEAQIAMFPDMMNEMIAGLICEYGSSAFGWKLSGAGGGGYLILVSDRPIENAVRVIARRETD